MAMMMRLAIAMLMLAWGLRMEAQELSTTKPFTNYKVPEVDEKGNLKWLLRGASGRFRSQDVLELKDVRVEFYEENKVTMTAATAGCLFHTKTKRAESEELFTMQSADFMIAARGMEWEAKQNVIRLKKDVQITLPPRARSKAFGAETKTK